MFHMGDDKKILAVSAASAAVPVLAGLWLGRSIVNSIDAVRDASQRLARGELSVRAPRSGPAEIDDLAASFNEMAANLEKLFDARRELVAWASHDLRTPLANIQAMLEALQDGLMQPAEALPRSKSRRGGGRRWSTTCSSWRRSTPAPSGSKLRGSPHRRPSARVAAGCRGEPACEESAWTRT